MTARRALAVRSFPGVRQQHRQLRVMKLALRSFWANGEWPHVSSLQQDVARSGSTFDVRETAAQLPGRYGGVDDADRLVLTLAGVRACDAGHELLNDYVRVVRFAGQRYIATRAGRPSIRKSQLERQLGLPKQRARCVVRLLDAEPDLFVRRTRLGGAWTEWIVGEAICHCMDIEGIDDYLAARERHRNVGSGRPACRRRLVRGLGRALGRISERALARTIALVLAMLFFGLVPIGDAGPGERPPRLAPPPQRTPAPRTSPAQQHAKPRRPQAPVREAQRS